MPLQKDLTELLWSRHMRSLRVLRFNHIGDFELEPIDTDGAIEELSCGFGDAHDNIDSLTFPVLRSCTKALQHLRLGSDERASHQKFQTHSYLSVPIGSLYNILCAQTPALDNLRSLHLVGVQLRCPTQEFHYM